jgi:hypothetical protein
MAEGRPNGDERYFKFSFQACNRHSHPAMRGIHHSHERGDIPHDHPLGTTYNPIFPGNRIIEFPAKEPGTFIGGGGDGFEDQGK